MIVDLAVFAAKLGMVLGVWLGLSLALGLVWASMRGAA